MATLENELAGGVQRKDYRLTLAKNVRIVEILDKIQELLSEKENRETGNISDQSVGQFSTNLVTTFQHKFLLFGGQASAVETFLLENASLLVSFILVYLKLRQRVTAAVSVLQDCICMNWLLHCLSLH